MPEKILIFPFGGNARESLLSIFAVNSLKKKWDIAGFIDDEPSLAGRECCGVKVLGTRDAFKRYPDARVLAVPGNPDTYLKRREVIDSLGIKESNFATVTHPSVAVSPDARIGYNTLLMPNVVISCGARVGNHCIVLPNTVIAHDSIIGDYCCVGSNVTISGGVHIGPECYVGSGVKIKEGLRIGKRALLGLGANVLSDIEEGIVAVGNPARAIRKAV